MNGIEKITKNNNPNYILPMLWLRDESKEKIELYLDKIYQSGIKSVTLESRPHEEYLSDGWWKDIEIVMNKANILGMKVWLFDDSHFPTGGIAGNLKENNVEFKKRYLDVKRIDLLGPSENVKILTKYFINHPFKGDKELSKYDEVLFIVAARRDKESGKVFLNDAILLNPDNEFIHWDIPEGAWSVFIIKKTLQGGESQTEHHLDPLNEKAANMLIEKVYKPHFDKFGEKYKQTFAGFFSDEHRFGNVKGFDGTLGKKMVLPWSDELYSELQIVLGGDVAKLLPALWYNADDQEAVRYNYMEAVSNLYAKNFTGVLSGWCQSRGLEYISHVIEDNGAHSRLGYGSGHYFKSLWPQHMAGIDVVLHQLLPGFDDEIYSGFTDSGWNGEFFHYGLAKLGSSLARIDEKKHGRAFCEVFGAYGWAEGLKLMKWLVDHMLVRGINHFMPHAFSMKPFPDWDCPPHLYADGKDPQYKYLPQLMGYTQRLCDLSNNSTADIKIAVLYHAESEWAGKYMPFEKVAKELTRNQLDFDIVPCDFLYKESFTTKKYTSLIIPYTEVVTARLANRLVELVDKGIDVQFIDMTPGKMIMENGDVTELEQQYCFSTVFLSELSNYLELTTSSVVYFSGDKEYLRACHRISDDFEFWMITNEHPYFKLKGELTFNSDKTPNVIYDPIKDLFYDINHEEIVVINPYQSLIYMYVNDLSLIETSTMNATNNKLELNGLHWDVCFSSISDYPKFSVIASGSDLACINRKIMNDNLSGIVRYETNFNFHEDTDNCQVDLGNLSECCELWVNQVYIGSAISPPYIFDISNYINIGENSIKIEVTTNLANEQMDFLSSFMPIEQNGLFGPLSLCI